MTASKAIKIDCAGYATAADWYEGKKDSPILLNLSGYSSTKARYVPFIEKIVSITGASVLALDLSGHGESPFKLEDVSPAQNFIEVVAAFDWLKNKFPKRKIWVMGTSYGGFLASQLTKYREFDKLVLRVPAIYRPQNFYTKWGDYNPDEELGYRKNEKTIAKHPLLERAANFKGRVLVVTHELDDVCPPNSTAPFIHAFKADHWEVKGFQHSFGESKKTPEQEEAYYAKVAEWLKK